MKKLKLCIISLILLILPINAYAASGSIKVTSTSSVVLGNKVTVTVTLSSGTNIGSWEMDLNYDKNYLQLTSSSAESKGTFMSNYSSGTKSKKYTFTFKALKAGSTKVSVGSYAVYAFDDMSKMTINSSSKTIKIITQAELEASYSKDNNLKSLEVEGYELSPSFSKDTLDYVVYVPEGTTSVNVIAKENDSKASVSGDGAVSVSEGANNISVIVRAENGSEKKYNIVVNVVDQNPINVEVDNEKYTVIKLRSNYTCPELFTESEIEINGFKIPACINEKINYTLIGLKKEDGSVDNFIYDHGKYTKYSEVVGTSLKIIAINYDSKIDGLKETTAKINDKEYQVFKFSDSSRFYVVYGMNVETGEKNFYVYDSKNNTFSLYDTEHIDYLKEQNKLYLYVIIAFGVSLFLLLICTISLVSSKNKLKKKHKNLDSKNEPTKKSKKEKQERLDKEIKENIIKEDINELKEKVNNDEETYNLFEEDRRKKTKPKK